MSTKVALVTASSAGLGAAVAKALAQVGFRVAINYHSSQDKAERLVQDILGNTTSESRQPSSIAIRADMSQRSDIKMLVERTHETMGRIDVVVSNQGWAQMRTFDDLDDNIEEHDWDKCFNMNVKSRLYLFHAAKPFLAATQGSFVTVASLAGVIPSGSSIPYSITKAVQIHLVKALAKISGPSIRVNSVSPGILLTEWGKKFPAAKLDAATDKSVLKRLAVVEDAAQQIVLLATSSSITGQNAIVDAGWSLG